MITFSIPYTMPLPTAPSTTTSTQTKPQTEHWYSLTYQKQLTNEGLKLDWLLQLSTTPFLLIITILFLIYITFKITFQK